MGRTFDRSPRSPSPYLSWHLPSPSLHVRSRRSIHPRPETTKPNKPKTSNIFLLFWQISRFRTELCSKILFHQISAVGSVGFRSSVHLYPPPDAAVVCPKALMMFFKLENPTRRFSPTPGRPRREGRYDGPRRSLSRGAAELTSGSINHFEYLI